MMKILLIENRPEVGFGSNLDVMLRATIALNKMGITEIYYYWENILYGGVGENLFNKYIKNQKQISISDYKQFHAIQFAQNLLHYDLSEEQNKVLKNWSFFESEIFDKVKRDAASTDNAGVGIHVRNPDSAHLIYPKLDTYFEWADRVLNNYYDKNSNKNLVLVTDQDSTIGAFKYVYGERIKYNKNVYRTPFYYEWQHTSWPKWTDKSNLGYDFLLEAYVLSTCREIIYVGSNMATFAAALRPGNYYHQIPAETLDSDGGFTNVKKLNRQVKRDS